MTWVEAQTVQVGDTVLIRQQVVVVQKVVREGERVLLKGRTKDQALLALVGVVGESVQLLLGAEAVG